MVRLSTWSHSGLQTGFVLTCLVPLFVAATQPIADILPLQRGIHVPVGHACKGASSADVINYWGGHSSIGTSQGECTIGRLVKAGRNYTLYDRCKDIQSGETIEGGPTRLVVASPTQVRINGTAFRYYGAQREF